MTILDYLDTAEWFSWAMIAAGVAVLGVEAVVKRTRRFGGRHG